LSLSRCNVRVSKSSRGRFLEGVDCVCLAEQAL